MTDDPNDRAIRLENPAERWEIREGYLTHVILAWDDTGSTTTTMHLRREELQQVVNHAASMYGIRPQCACHPEEHRDDCPAHGQPAKFCNSTVGDDYNLPMACFLSQGHAGNCCFTRFAALPARHPLRVES